MGFKIYKREDFSYSTPQEMYQDNKLKKIRGLLDYQSEMLCSYMENESANTLALELPTGSGKTLVGLLIGEFRRRKNKERVLYLCPTNQLVNQVVEQAKEKYGLNAISFCGKQKDYSPTDRSSFALAKAIGVTTYSSFFAVGSIFTDVDIVIMDDVHSSEDYIISGWSIQIDGEDNCFELLSEWLKPSIGELEYSFLVGEMNDSEAREWCDIIPMPIIGDKIDELYSILQQGIAEGTPNSYALSRLAQNLEDCGIYLANKRILIRPCVAPTMTIDAFKRVKQRVLMSATLGKSGELERITGIEKIVRLPIVKEWDKKGLGRRFFIFPDLAFEGDGRKDVIKSLQLLCKKSVILVPDGDRIHKIRELYASEMEQVSVFEAKDIEKSKQVFVDKPEATVILANRFDGIDFSDEESRLLFIWNLPRTTNLQERFLATKMGARVLYDERIRTRIIQAVGRCSRNPSDYSIVCVIGDSIYDEIAKESRLRLFPPELRAEIQLGLENSLEYKSIDEMIEQANSFLTRNEEWQEAESYIVELRKDYWNEDGEAKPIWDVLSRSAVLELQYQYAVWKKDYKTAFERAVEIIDVLNNPTVGGYKSFWQYIAGNVAYCLYRKGEEEYKAKGISYWEKAVNASIRIKWLPSLPGRVYRESFNEVPNDDFFADCIERIEKVMGSFKTMQKLEAAIQTIIMNIKSDDGNTFESGHKDLGKMLGFIAENPSSSGAPDPYWIVNEKLIIVSEDKIVKTQDGEGRSICIADIDETNRHETWIREKEKSRISSDAKIITALVSNSVSLDEEAKMYAKNAYYVNREEFLSLAKKALTCFRTLWTSFSGSGNIVWRNNVHAAFMKEKLTPSDILSFFTSRKLEDLPVR